MATYIIGMVLIVIALEIGIVIGYEEGKKDAPRERNKQ